jgi:predicted nicotinamide N-methyase
MAWLKETQADILLGDPGRTYFPKTGLIRLAIYSVPTTRELEDREIRETGIWRLDRT